MYDLYMFSVHAHVKALHIVIRCDCLQMGYCVLRHCVVCVFVAGFVTCMCMLHVDMDIYVESWQRTQMKLCMCCIGLLYSLLSTVAENV